LWFYARFSFFLLPPTVSRRKNQNHHRDGSRDALARHSSTDWETAVKDSVRQVKSSLTLAKPGYHTLKFWMGDPGVVLQKIVVDLAGVRPSYLGPPESYWHWQSQHLRP
jgi:hypothetical protein